MRLLRLDELLMHRIEVQFVIKKQVESRVHVATALHIVNPAVPYVVGRWCNLQDDSSLGVDHLDRGCRRREVAKFGLQRINSTNDCGRHNTFHRFVFLNDTGRHAFSLLLP